MLNKWVKYWLFTGLVFLFVQVIVGGITRLTESGLSITKWDIVSGTLPPLTDKDWIEAFESYQRTPQYKEINEGMELDDFKFIFFWEYVHRLWARWMGVVFIVPFIFFYSKKLLDGHLLRRLGGVVLMAALAASFGWIMVASGLINRPWVNAYKLSLHLCIAFVVFTLLLWTFLEYRSGSQIRILSSAHNPTIYFLLILWLQLFLGGVMSGMKAGVFFPTWPDMNGSFFPQVLFNIEEWSVDNFNYYEKSTLLPALVQTCHRMTAYILFFYGLYMVNKLYKSTIKYTILYELKWFIILLITQVVLGIITVLMCKGEVPVLWGVLHQAGALLLLSMTLVLRFRILLQDILK